MPTPVQLRCEYLVNPLGIDVSRPRLSWMLNDDRRGARQSGYQVQVASSRGGAVPDSPAELHWDSGKVDSDQSVHVEYAGPALKSRQRCDWKVRLWDADGTPTDWSAAAFFEMGLLERADWKARWIGSWIVGGPRTGAP